MDLYGAIAELLNEKKRLDRLISSLEAMQEGGLPVQEPPKRRGRKNMSEGERREVSERMKKYWAARRQDAAADPVNTSAS
jgi:hypothetical protein